MLDAMFRRYVAFRAGNHQWRAQGDRSTKMPAAASAADDQAIVPAEIDDARELRRIKLLFRIAIFYQFHADQQSLAPDIANDLEIHQPPEPVEQIGPHLFRTAHKPLRLHDLDIAQRDRARDRMAAISIHLANLPVLRWITIEAVEHVVLNHSRG